MADLFFFAQGSTSGLGALTPFILMMIIFYFLLIRPQQKQRKELEAQVAAMKKGDSVVTAGGVHAIVHHISERTVTLKLAKDVLVKFEKSSIQRVLKSKAHSSDEKKADADDAESTES